MEPAIVTSNQINVSSHQNDDVSESNITKRRRVARKTSGNINISKHFPFFADSVLQSFIIFQFPFHFL